jgi:hypothetical protein
VSTICAQKLLCNSRPLRRAMFQWKPQTTPKQTIVHMWCRVCSLPSAVLLGLLCPRQTRPNRILNKVHWPKSFQEICGIRFSLHCIFLKWPPAGPGQTQKWPRPQQTADHRPTLSSARPSTPQSDTQLSANTPYDTSIWYHPLLAHYRLL